jgi:twinkle protein
VPSLRDALDAYKIALPSYTAGQHRLQCPLCRGGSDGERSLAVAVEAGGATARWLCHRATCGWTGGVSATGATAPDGAAPPQVVIRGTAKGGAGTAGAAPAAEAKAPADLPREADILPASSNATVAAFFAGRGISEATLQRNGVGVARVWNPPAGRVADSIVFPYRRAGTLVNCKYRAVESKTFWQSKGGEKVLYGLDDIADAEQVVIVEGEMDKLAMEQAGFRNCVSVPDGAPAKVKDGPTPAPEDDKKFSYLWNCRAWLDRVKTFIIATDADEPGEALAEELARRLGRERCWRVSWPGTAVAGEAAPDPESVRKDANEVLMKDGPEALATLVAGAQPVPIRGLFQFTDFSDEIDRYYGLELHAELRGLPTGWVGVDQLYRVVPGELTVVTGVPNSGKSEWVDALMCNLAVTAGWSFALCSMENKVHEHARKLIEKFTGRPFFDGEYAGSARRMSPQELAAGKAFLADHFVLIRHEDDELPSIDWVLGLARAAVLRYGIRGLLVDPYNELDHRRPTNVSETEYVSQMLTRIKRFAAHHDVHVWFVAHPRQLQNWRGEPPGLYEISGSAHFVNKCDNGLVVHRNRTDPARANEVRVLVQKVRNKVAGRIGETTLLYDRASGRYADSDQKSQPLRFPEGGNNSAFQAPREGR